MRTCAPMEAPLVKPIDLWKKKKHRSLAKAVKARLPKSEFNSAAIPRKQITRFSSLGDRTPTLHPTWKSLDSSRLSAACLFERARLQLFMAGVIHPLLTRSKLDFYHVIVADKRWRVSPPSATHKSFDPPRRKVRSAIEKLRSDGYKPIFLAAYEMSGNHSLEEPYVFEPHVHLIVGGAPVEALKAAFQVRLPRGARGRDKPVRVSFIQNSELGNLLGYLTKMKAQDRVEYLGSNGRTNRASNRMRTVEANLWLRCMATLPITHAIQFGGFATSVTALFINAEMATIVRALK